ncbi:MAG TPA: TfuA-like protein [Pilimelia sp.]|nr:TfuA-like protein [Pilimelia sp.]
MSPVVVFRGPTISAAQVRSALPDVDLRCAPPAAQGDVYRAVCDGARVIALVDGTFERGPAVWHKEILHALHEGVAVFGAASMGALRAVECAPFGMRPVGQIAAWYADGTLTDDDEVTVAHLDAEHDWRCTSEAMVNIRATLASVPEGMIGAATRAALLARAKRTFYPERSWPRLLADARAEAPPQELAALARWLPEHRVDLKHRDARQLLAAVAAAVATGEPTGPPTGWRPEPSRIWLRARTAMEAGRPERDLDALIDALRLDDAWYELHQAAFLRHLALADARRHGVDPDPESAVADLRAALGLATDEQLAAWCDANDLDAAGLHRLATDQARLAWAHRRHGDEVRAAVADQLRIRGWYATAAPPDGPHPGDPVDDAAAWRWYAGTRDPAGRGWPDPREGPEQRAALAAHLGFDTPQDLTRAVRRAYRAAHPAPEPAG